MAVPENKSGVTRRATVHNSIFELYNVLRKNFVSIEARSVSEEIFITLKPDEQKEYGLLDDMNKRINMAEIYIDLLDRYLTEAKFITKDEDKKILKYSLEGMKADIVAEKLKMPPSTVRVHKSRMTRKIYRELFAQEDPPTGLVFFSDYKVMSDCKTRLSSIVLNVNLAKSLEPTFYSKIQKKASRAKDVVSSEVSNESYYNALYDICLHLNAMEESRLNDISDEACAFIFKNMHDRGTDSSESKLLVRILSDNAFIEKLSKCSRAEFERYVSAYFRHTT